MSIQDQYAGFVDRLKSERGDLAAKLQGIEHFIERNMPGASDTQKALIEAQHHAMKTYHGILDMRLRDLLNRDRPTVASATMPELGEPKEILNADEDRDGPVPFEG